VIELEQYKSDLKAAFDGIKELGDSLNLVKAEEEVKELEAKTSAPGFWDDAENSAKILKKIL